MESALDILRIVLPIVIAGAIAVFVVKRLEIKHRQGTLGKKESKEAQTLLDSLIPLGVLFGCMIGLLFGMFFSISFPTGIALGAAIGLLIGYFAYEFYSKEEEGHS